ncbi:MAG: class I SAM-dependent methyltransferase [Oculatellaceae cyanobacterium Prado106]|jgi:ubiquinone/menaquinone biosynthesis C-methylase UbiE|nr:class I SAM-dependent methyltransferase [Oculatellaceae cyanobacterium Prado106]
MSSNPVQAEYSKLAQRYDDRWSFYVTATVQQTLNRLALKSGERILDLGCGTGTLIQQLLQINAQLEVTGLDPTAEMIAVAQQKLPPSVDLRVASATSIPFPDATFDRVISTSAFHYFRDPAPALEEVHRVLKPGGQLILTDWCKDYLTCYFLDLFLRVFNRAHFRTYRATELHALLQNAGFQQVNLDRYKINWFWGMMTARAMKGDR